MSWPDMLTAASKRRGILRHAIAFRRRLLNMRVPVFRPLAALLWIEREVRGYAIQMLLKVLYREPLLRYRCAHVGSRLHIYGAMPIIVGNGRIEIGDDVHIDGHNAWQVGHKVSTGAELVIGDRVYVGYRNNFSIAKSLRIGSDTIMAPSVLIYDNPSHPMSPAARLRNEPFDLEDASPVVIGCNCWLGTGAIILKGVTIGDGSVVAAASVVTKSVPPNTVVAGNPARVIRTIDD